MSDANTISISIPIPTPTHKNNDTNRKDLVELKPFEKFGALFRPLHASWLTGVQNALQVNIRELNNIDIFLSDVVMCGDYDCVELLFIFESYWRFIDVCFGFGYDGYNNGNRCGNRNEGVDGNANAVVNGEVANPSFQFIYNNINNINDDKQDRKTLYKTILGKVFSYAKKYRQYLKRHNRYEEYAIEFERNPIEDEVEKPWYRNDLIFYDRDYDDVERWIVSDE